VNPKPTTSTAVNNLATTFPLGYWMRLSPFTRRSILFQTFNYSAITSPSTAILATCHAADHIVLKFSSLHAPEIAQKFRAETRQNILESGVATASAPAQTGETSWRKKS
jgi:hypothetical protein